ncbi:MAG: aldehyde dehydrogenase family protein [Acidobacteria bacterium]|nr:aldehyde dehydrogenase family protein [Acidobacteriota bacterium]
MSETPKFPNYINGEWVAAEKTYENRNPADTSDVVGIFSKASAADVTAAANAAHEAFAGWAGLPGPARGNYLFKVADLLEKQLDSLAREMTREEGKTFPEAKGETMRSINIFRYFGGEGSRQAGVLAPSERPRVFMWAERKALGVVSLINPWNFPSAIPAWKLAPALISGNTVLLKPASAAPLSSWRIIEACHNAGIPKGVVNFLSGSGGEVGDAMVDNEHVKAVSFTGSCEVGYALHERASKRRIRIQLEMGGKNPTIVLADADMASAVANSLNAAMFSTGQKCTATSRIIVEESIYDEFAAKFIAETKKLKVGNGLAEGVHIGPAIDKGQLDVDANYCKIAEEEGATIACGGKVLSDGDYAKGYFFEPTVITNVTNDMRIAREEVFGPVAALIKAKDFDDAMAIANDTEFGLSASVQTQDVGRVFEFIKGIQAGLVTVNLPSAGVEYQLPFGGTKGSSFGPKEQGPAALEFYSDYKTVYLKY